MKFSNLFGWQTISHLPTLFASRVGNPALARDRSIERYRLAALTSTTAMFGKVVSLVVSVLTIRLTYRYLGAERYGMWLTLNSILMMLNFTDFGMNNGLVNLVADAMGREDTGAARKAVSSAFCLLSGLAIFFTLIGSLIYPLISPAKIFNVHSQGAQSEAGPALIIFFLFFVINLPLGSVRAVQTGLQKAYINNLWLVAGGLACLLSLIIAMYFNAGLPVLLIGALAPSVLAILLNGLELFCYSHPELMPSPKAFSWASASNLLRTGLMFFLLQVAVSVGLQSDNVVIAQILGAGAVASYAVPARLFNMVTSFVVMISGSMWPAYADALARLDGQWIRKSFIRVTTFGVAATAAVAVILVLFGNRILALWVGQQLFASPWLLLALACQCILYSYLHPMSFLLNGISRFRAQVICALLMAAVNLSLSIAFVRMYGIIGAALGTIISLLLIQVVPLTIVARNSLNEITSGTVERIGSAERVS